MINKVTVYCASSDKVAPKYFDAAEALGKLCANNDIEVIFGGGGKGLMAKLADSVLQHEGQITGIMPKFMKEVEWQHKEVKNFIFTETMSERKTLLIKDTDAIIALPGGCGTLEELLEVITLKRLGKFLKPIIVFNQDGFYDPLLKMFENCIQESFMRPEHRQIWSVANKVEDILISIENAPLWDQNAINFAAV